MVPEERARLVLPRADLHEALEMLGEIGARRALVVEALRRVLPIYTDWAGADPAVGAAFAATAAALPERVPDKLRAKLGKQLASATKAAQKAAGYDRKTERDRDPAARAAAYVAMALAGALEKHDTFETVTLGFVLLALEHACAGFERIAETIAWATSRARELEGDRDAGWQAAFSELTKRLVPREGEADTKQGEVIRCLGNLADEAMRNGNVNWGERQLAMVAYVRRELGNAAMFSDLERTMIERQLLILERGTVSRVGHRILARFAVRWCHGDRSGDQ
jgi:hypothetical protein